MFLIKNIKYDNIVIINDIFMKLKKAEIINLLIVMASVIFAIIVYPKMPEIVSSHWNSAGQVDGYMNRFWGTFILPIVLSAIWLLFIIVPRVDPKKSNIEKFRNQFDGFKCDIWRA